jgi:type II secretory pathway pseudopilin PulG
LRQLTAIRALEQGGASCKLQSVRVHSRGLTLAELLVFLALAALLSALGMYGLARYLRHSRTAEAVGALNTLGASAAAAYDASDATQPAGTEPSAARAMRHFPPSSRTPVPADLADIRGKQYRSASHDWDPSPWRELRFSIPQPQFYAYSFRSEGVGSAATATAVAQGDLNGDGHMSEFSLGIAPDGAGNGKAAATIQRVDPEE